MDKNKKLLSEELKKFKLLSEYTFYIPKDNIEEADDEGKEEDLEPVGDAEGATYNVDADVEAVGDELGVDTDNTEEIPDLNATDDMGGEEMPDLNADAEMPPAEEQPIPDAAPMEDEVELDVTQLVQGTEEAKQIAAQGNQKIDQLMSKFNELEGKLGKMDAINAKIDNLEHEVEKRIPTPAEKLEMKSLSSYPYSLKLTDYWAEKEGIYDVMGTGEKKDEVYTLTKDDVNSGFSDNNIKNSFNEYEEEDI